MPCGNDDRDFFQLRACLDKLGVEFFVLSLRGLEVLIGAGGQFQNIFEALLGGCDLGLALVVFGVGKTMIFTQLAKILR